MTSLRSTHARSFDAAAALYAANRPSYPGELFDAVEELAGRSLDGARVGDVGAGTGIATALLHARGARVVAVEPGDGMAAELRRAHPGIPLVRGDGDRLPLATGAFDLLTYAQAWHWTDPARSVPEARRVLRPGGALALWWNDADCAVPWIGDQDRRIADLFDAKPGTAPRGLPEGLDFRTREVRWVRRIPVDAHLANLASHSAFLVLGPGAEEFFAAERAALLSLFPGGEVLEEYVVTLCVARL
ncbi:class I SAM-dependent methyltransferase [Streptomyces sp. G-G2]|uniref:class I SAM-dependent methyltransferase n=1 Tax=Streptomyces sp. G-G2 TaxID=3046201 RepID=UPI0024BB1B70|nr:class I SAM-dependent methyltransferase [Streptomyces sp. G-G2]MDJ0384342.1 class I SAM-dependent methyltransferase [Streptomyces sp. G-G2]